MISCREEEEEPRGNGGAFDCPEKSKDCSDWQRQLQSRHDPQRRRMAQICTSAEAESDGHVSPVRERMGSGGGWGARCGQGRRDGNGDERGR